MVRDWVNRCRRLAASCARHGNQSVDAASSTGKPPAESPAASGLDVPPIDFDYFKPLLDSLNSTRQSIFITGKAGTGKSTLLRLFSANTHKRVAVLAPTGLAALNVGGQTIHSFFRFKPQLLEEQDITFSPLRAHLYRHLDALVIDEVSMVRADTMNAIDLVLRRHRDSSKPFGGLQMILFGDLFQLPPVVERSLEQYFKRQYGGPYFFHAHAFRNGFDLRVRELSKVFRQEDERFIRMLGNIRTGEPSDEDLVGLNGRSVTLTGTPPRDTVILTCTNAVAAKTNNDSLHALPGDEALREALLSGSLKEVYDRLLLRFASDPDRLELELNTRFPANVRLRLKEQAKVIMVRNDPQRRWVNGSIGTVLAIHPDQLLVSLEGGTFNVGRETWEDIEYELDGETGEVRRSVRGTFCQYPVRLAWALTIHKAQGLTIPRVCVDIGRGAFAPGQTYVALSRCRSLDGLFLTREIKSEHIFVDPTLRDFHGRGRPPAARRAPKTAVGSRVVSIAHAIATAATAPSGRG